MSLKRDEAASLPRECYRISTSLNKEAWRQPILVQYHHSAVQESFLEMRPGPRLGMCLEVNCREEEEADSATFISYDYLKPCGAGSARRAIAPNGRNTNTSVGVERIPRCWSTLGPHSRQGTNSGWCWGIRPPRKASSGQRTGHGHHHTLETNIHV